VATTPLVLVAVTVAELPDPELHVADAAVVVSLVVVVLPAELVVVKTITTATDVVLAPRKALMSDSRATI
jgi:hypothetical protein